MGTENKKSRGLAKGWPLAILALLTALGCSRSNDSSVRSATGSGRPELDNPELWKEIISVSDSNYCLCTTEEEVGYYFSHPKEFMQCKSVEFLNVDMDCDTLTILLGMKHIESLSVSNLSCRQIPEHIIKTIHLRELYINFPSGIDTVPSILFRIPNVEYLGVYGKTLAHFDKDIPIAPKLGSLSFGTSPIKRLPMVFGKFPELSTITAGSPGHLVENDTEFRKAYPDLAFDTNDPD